MGAKSASNMKEYILVEPFHSDEWTSFTKGSKTANLGVISEMYAYINLNIYDLSMNLNFKGSTGVYVILFLSLRLSWRHSTLYFFKIFIKANDTSCSANLFPIHDLDPKPKGNDAKG